MATKRKPGAGRTKAAPTKKVSARSAPKKPVPAAKHKHPSKAGVGKPMKAGKVKKVEKVVKATTKPVKTAAVKLKPVKPAAVVRPIGALPPEAVARAVQKAPPLPAQRPGRPVVKSGREVAEGGAPGVTEKDYKEFEQRLMAERQKILKEMGHLENTVLKVNQRDSAGDLSGYSFHMADVGTDAMEREKAFMFASNEGALLKEIGEALRKVYRGEFGVCENCGRPI